MKPPPAPAPLRLAVVVSHPIQYYAPWFQWMRNEAGLDFHVFYLWSAGATPALDPQFGQTMAWDVDLCGGYAHEFVPNTARRPGTDHFFGLRNPDLTARLEAYAPSAVLLFGYAYDAHLRVIAWAGRRRVPLIFRGDSHLLGRGNLGFWKEVVLGRLYRRFAAVLYTGHANRAYFERLGVPAARLFFAPHSVDAARFNPERADVQAAAAGLRRELGLDSATRVVLFAGKFVPAKQPLALLEAFLDLAPRQAVLVFAGDGEQRTALESRAAERGALGTSIRLLPFTNQAAMPALHAIASVFVLPSRGVSETWGLAVNEAMHMGVPALVSDRVGCQPDLVTDGVTGWVFAADDPSGLRRALERALSVGDDARRTLRAAVMDRISGYRYPQTTAGLLQACASLTPS